MTTFPPYWQLFFPFCCTGGGAQSLMNSRQMIYHWADDLHWALSWASGQGWPNIQEYEWNGLTVYMVKCDGGGSLFTLNQVWFPNPLSAILAHKNNIVLKIMQGFLCIPGCPLIHYVADSDLELLSSPPKFCLYNHAQFIQWWVWTQDLVMLVSHSTTELYPQFWQ